MRTRVQTSGEPVSNLMRRNRARMEVELRDSWKRAYLSPAISSLTRALVPRLRAVAHGRFLDVGSGTMPFRAEVAGLVDEYRSLDVQERVGGVDFIADVMDMAPVDSGSFDVVLCSQVLEHVNDPARALAEIHRVLAPGGRLVLTVPFLSRLHEVPHDYFRYTEFGLRHLLAGAGSRVESVDAAGSLASFTGHQVSTVLLCSTWGVPVLRDVVFWLNLAFVVLPCAWIDRAVALRRQVPLNYVVVARTTT